ncbi:hypothetical protein RIF29_04086 [Crotalaria pallida]|uniref:Uncharacterized protein n=1 Tax=Crotalaria pallida TaxID=3830 RepID=A0AAN9J1K8_CROPI
MTANQPMETSPVLGKLEVCYDAKKDYFHVDKEFVVAHHNSLGVNWNIYTPEGRKFKFFFLQGFITLTGRVLGGWKEFCQEENINHGDKDMASISIADLKAGRESRILHARVNRAWKVIHRGNIIRYMHIVLIDAQIEDPYGFPPAIYTLCEREFVFLIDVNLRHNILRKKESYTILQMIDDGDIIKAFHESTTTNQEMTSLSAENDPYALKTPDNNVQRKKKSFAENQQDIPGLSQLQTP